MQISRPNSKVAAVLLLLPALLLFVTLFVVPFGTLALYSFYGYSRTAGIIRQMGLGNYARIWTDDYYLSIVIQTLKQSFAASLVTLVVGYPVALFILSARPRIKGLVILAIISPLLISVVVRSFGWLIILGPGGPIDKLSSALGFGALSLLHTPTAVIIGLTNVFLSFMVLSIVASLQQVAPQVLQAASSLGASRFRVFWHVTLPLSLPGVLSGLLIVFSLSSSAFIGPAMLGGADYGVIATQIFEQTLSLHNWPFGAALSVSLVVIVLTILTLQTYLVERGRFQVVFR